MRLFRKSLAIKRQIAQQQRRLHHLLQKRSWFNCQLGSLTHACLRFDISDAHSEESPEDGSWSFFSEDVVDVESPEGEQQKPQQQQPQQGQETAAESESLFHLLRGMFTVDDRAHTRRKRRSKKKNKAKSATTKAPPKKSTTEQWVEARTLRPYSEKHVLGMIDYPITEGEEVALLELFKRTMAAKRQMLGQGEDDDDDDFPDRNFARRSPNEEGKILLHLQSCACYNFYF